MMAVSNRDLTQNVPEIVENSSGYGQNIEIDDEWSLTTDQMIFMMQHHNLIEQAFEDDDMDSLRTLAASEAFKLIFHDISFDEAYDRYESMLEDERASS